MEQTPEPRRRLNVLTKAERRRRIFARLREGWAYDEIAREERVSAERIRQIVSEVLAKRVIDRGDRLDKHQDTVVAKHSYGPEERQRLLDKINRVAANLAPVSGEPAAPTADAHENNSAELPV